MIMETNRRMMRLTLTLLVCSILNTAYCQTSTLLGFDGSGRLTYNPDANGNVIPDFSYVGYHHGEQDIPDVPIVHTISPVSGDNRLHIQAAIDAVESMTPDANGFRGALLLQAGTYNVSNTLYIQESGVVIRGEGNSTVVNATGTFQHSLFQFQGDGGTSNISSSEKEIIDNYVPIGAQSFTVESGHSFLPGDRIYLQIAPNQSWINMLGMHDLSSSDPGDTDWTPSAYTLRYKRYVTEVSGDVITIDAPVVDPIVDGYATGSIYKYTWNNRLEEVGIENIRLESSYTSDSDENHAWHAVSFSNTENAWMQNVNAYYFGYSCANISSSCYKISVLSCSMIDPKSQTTGGRKYSFNCNGQQILFKDCYAWGGRHDYVTGARVPGPNTFVNCVSENQKSTTGPHHRWATGQLYDNVVGDKDFAAENRETSGSGHGWAGAQIMFWNCTTTTKFVMHDPPGDHMNWCIGCSGTITNVGFMSTEPYAYVESQNNALLPTSLYEKQLCDRLVLPGCTATPTCEDVSASSNDGNIPANVLDNDLNTRWSADGDGQYIQFCLGQLVDINRIDIAFFNGDQRTSTFDILASEDGLSWTTVQSGLTSSGISLELEPFTFPMITAQYIRIVGHGNSANTWNSYTEVDIRQDNIPYNGTAHVIPGLIESEEYDFGGKDISWYDDTEGNEGGELRTDDVDVQTSSENGYNIGWVSADEWLEYTVDVTATGYYDFNLRMASTGAGRFLRVEMDGVDITGSIEAPNTGDYQAYETVTVPNINLTQGEKVMRIYFESNSMNITYINVTASDVDCNGDPSGTASVDNCGVCSGGSTGVPPNSTCVQDCNGDWNGTASVDNCGVCSGGNTGVTPNSTCTQDCAGDWGGAASIDDCGACSGGNSGIIPNSTCTQDCNGDWGGSAYIDGCGQCVEGNTGELPCADDCNGDPGGSASIDDCGVCSDGLTGVTPNSTCAQDCNGDWDGKATIDNCGICSGGLTGTTPNSTCAQDCNGDWGGTASIDVCGVCSGGNTGLVPETNTDNCVTSIADQESNLVYLYPNPTSGIVNLSLTSDWVLSNVVGEILQSGHGSHIDLTFLPSGMYFVEIGGRNIKLLKD